MAAISPAPTDTACKRICFLCSRAGAARKLGAAAKHQAGFTRHCTRQGSLQKTLFFEDRHLPFRVQAPHLTGQDRSVAI